MHINVKFFFTFVRLTGRLFLRQSYRLELRQACLIIYHNVSATVAKKPNLEAAETQNFTTKQPTTCQHEVVFGTEFLPRKLTKQLLP